MHFRAPQFEDRLQWHAMTSYAHEAGICFKPIYFAVWICWRTESRKPSPSPQDSISVSLQSYIGYTCLARSLPLAQIFQRKTHWTSVKLLNDFIRSLDELGACHCHCFAQRIAARNRWSNSFLREIHGTFKPGSLPTIGLGKSPDPWIPWISHRGTTFLAKIQIDLGLSKKNRSVMSIKIIRVWWIDGRWILPVGYHCLLYRFVWKWGALKSTGWSSISPWKWPELGDIPHFRTHP